ncbi:MAG TPA: hypothetical protein EYP85_07760 [Armatimonadetes bacterium]|nr:hypothetical protein [Armatimonadota bacterium]
MKVRLYQLQRQFRAQWSLADRAARNFILGGAGIVALVLLMLSPSIGSSLSHAAWLGLFAVLAIVSFLTVPWLHRHLREVILRYRLGQLLPLDLSIWERCGQLGALPEVLARQVEGVLTVYLEMQAAVARERNEFAFTLRRYLTEAKENVLLFLDLTASTRRLQQTLEQHGFRLPEEDRRTLRRKFAERCHQLEQIVYSFDRSLAHLVLTQVALDDTASVDAQEVAQRMRAIEEEMGEVKEELFALNE